MSELSKGFSKRCLVSATALMLGLSSVSMVAAAEISISAENSQQTELVFYSGNLGQVSQIRRGTLEKGPSTLALADVSPYLLLDSLFLGGQDIRVREQRLDREVLSPQRLLEASLGKTVTVVKTNPETGEETSELAQVLAVREGLVLKIGDRIETTVPGRLVYDAIPEGLRSEPALLAVVESNKAGDQDLSLTYLTTGLEWGVTYVAELAPAGDRLQLTAMATLTNQTGVDFKQADVRLVAGDVNRVSAPRYDMMQKGGMPMASMAMESDVAMPERQSVADRDVYSVPGKIDIGGNESKQISLLENSSVEVERRFRFQGLIMPYNGQDDSGRQQAEIVLKTKNAKDKGLGQALPAGTLRVYQKGTDKAAAIFMGEDLLPAVPVGEDFELLIGSANQVSGQAKQTSYEQLSRNSYQLSQEISLSNSGKEAVVVDVIGQLPGNWKILEESAKHKTESARKVVWSIEVPAEGKSKFDYKLRVSHE
ncbi:DUF4139 domain-containing protein [Kiloniella laminariae]|uniref:DUF4139 domain-containing protein n=1 Tax=Kiloniella laminariae TaxID=454162 RepID=A0ABT4LKE9_9PROT|nr:DUF4139 domain-containing protein [Kiloniella laminariae]MCZ4281588.1 DUF4139 domain-containing protein [Kiloniella laminariae]